VGLASWHGDHAPDMYKLSTILVRKVSGPRGHHVPLVHGIGRFRLLSDSPRNRSSNAMLGTQSKELVALRGQLALQEPRQMWLMSVIITLI